MTENQKWAISLFEVGDAQPCLYSYCCTQCALAQARTNLDGSSCCFNFFFLTSCPARWMIRTTYGIPGDAYEDCYLPYFCNACVTNQVTPLLDMSYPLDRFITRLISCAITHSHSILRTLGWWCLIITPTPSTTSHPCPHPHLLPINYLHNLPLFYCYCYCYFYCYCYCY